MYSMEAFQCGREGLGSEKRQRMRKARIVRLDGGYYPAGRNRASLVATA